VPAVITVNSAGDDYQVDTKHLTLRDAIELVNGTLAASDLTKSQKAQVSGTVFSGVNGTDTIRFKIGHGATTPQTISLTGPLPSLAEAVTIDATTQDGWGGGSGTGWAEIPVVKLTTSLSTAVSGLVVLANGCTLKGLEITGFTSDGISVYGNQNVVADCYLHNNMISGVGLYDGASDNTVGGTSGRLRNVLSANEFGVHITGNGTEWNTVLGDYIGTDVAGVGNFTQDQPVGVGIDAGAANNTVGGTTASARNVISNNVFGVAISDDGTTGNRVQGNYIGTDKSGTTQAPNFYGVYVSQASNNTIGGTSAGAGNVLSGNSLAGVILQTGATNHVQGNYIGTEYTGNRPLQFGSSPQSGVIIEAGEQGSTVTGNVISGNGGTGIDVSGTTLNNFVTSQIVIAGNIIGADRTGTVKTPNGGDGVRIEGAVNAVTVGGPTAADRNIISGNGGNGIAVARRVDSAGNVLGVPTYNFITGNYVGTDVSGFAQLGNAKNGVLLDHTGILNFVGVGPGGGNLISGNDGNGVDLEGATNSDVEGNRIGTNVLGSAPLPNGAAGVRIAAGAQTNFVLPGSIVPGSATPNVISGNVGDGVLITGTGTSGNWVAQSLIGTDATGTAPVPNGGSGVHITGGASNNLVGSDGIAPYSGDTIAFNRGDGVLVEGGSGNSVVADFIFSNTLNGVELSGGAEPHIQGNRIGTNPAGTARAGNGGAGVYIHSGSTGSVVGGNVISANSLSGVFILGSVVTRVVGNDIGTDSTGTVGLGNAQAGVAIHDSPGTVVGGAAPGEGNTISDNGLSGVELSGGNATNCVVSGNRIGTDVTGTSPLGNHTNGVLFLDGAIDNLIGQSDVKPDTTGNTIAFNTDAGVYVDSGDANTISRNSIYENGTLGIYLNTANGANNNIPAPQLTGRQSGATGAVVSGTVQGLPPNSTVVIEIFTNFGLFGTNQGQVFTARISVQTDASGTANFSAPVGNLAGLASITATVTDAAGDTSEFSVPLNLQG
jgi:titin